MKAGAADGAVLKHPTDRSLGNVYKFLPEWNLRDITDPNSTSLLDILKHRAAHSPWEQYAEGVNGGPGDHEVIVSSMRSQGLRHIDDFEDCWTFFIDGQYGSSFKILKEKEETLAGFASLIKAGYCIPQSVGELVLQRQMYLLQGLVIMIDDILEEGSKTRKKKPTAKPSDDSGSAAHLASALGALNQFGLQPSGTTSPASSPFSSRPKTRLTVQSSSRSCQMSVTSSMDMLKLSSNARSRLVWGRNGSSECPMSITRLATPVLLSREIPKTS
jgi:hypothetical protein